MKIRNGFVSNSSSSSFIVAFSKDIELTKESIKDYLFGEQKFITGNDDSITTDEATDIILKDMINQKPNDDKNLLEACRGNLQGAPSWEDFKKKNGEPDWKKCEEARDEYVTKFLNDLKERTKSMDLYTFEFSDNDSSYYSILEHGGTFDNVFYKQI